MSGNSVRPPHGSVFDDLQLKSGPPMLRMICLQMAFAFVSKLNGFSQKFKAILIGCVCAYFLFSDLNSFLDQRNPNLFTLLGVNRSSDSAFIDERLNAAKLCYLEPSEETCSSFNYDVSNRLNNTEIEQIRFAFVKKPQFRELYDKTEIFMRPKFEKTYHNPS